MKKKRTRYSAEFKAKVALDAVREHDTVASISRRHKVHANQVYTWKRELLDKVARVFATGDDASGDAAEREAELLRKIGELTMERDFLSNGLGRSR